MKYIGCGIVSLMMVFGVLVTAGAATMCVRDDTVMVVLDELTRSGTSSGSGTQWSVTFNYGKVTGVAACNTTSGGTIGKISNTNMEVIMAGSNCWCKMLKPVASKWIYSSGYGNADLCSSNCAKSCISQIGNDVAGTYRRIMFGSVGQ